MNGNGAMLTGCASCTGDCCRKYRVEVNAVDVRVLAAGTALHPGDFLTLRQTDRNRGFRMRPDGPPMELNLIRRQNGGCVLLMEIAPDVARCGVYAHRPLVCSNFPTALKHGVVTIRDDVTCTPGSWNLAAMDLQAYRRDHGRSVAAWTEHWQIVEAWNVAIDSSGREASPDDLYQYLLSYRPHQAQQADPGERAAHGRQNGTTM